MNTMICEKRAFVIFVLLGISIPLFSESNVGVFVSVTGKVSLKDKESKETKAKNGLNVSDGDTIITGKDGKARIIFKNSTIINVTENSSFVIENVSSNEQKKSSFGILFGKIRAVVSKTDGNSNHEFKTKTVVAGIRGTEFNMGFDGNNTELATFNGGVEVSTVGSTESVMVNAGQKLTMDSNTRNLASQVQTMSAQTLADENGKTQVAEQAANTETVAVETTTVQSADTTLLIDQMSPVEEITMAPPIRLEPPVITTINFKFNFVD